MLFSCVICADMFNDGQVIVAFKCGHVFHENCIHTWINQSNTCPECRKRILYTQRIKLYFNVVTDGSVSPSLLSNEVSTLTAQLSAKKIELLKEHEEKETLREYVRIAENKAENLQQEMYAMKSDAVRSRQILKDFKKKAARVDDLESRNTFLMNQIQMYNNINTILKGTQKDVEDVLESMSESPDSLKNLVTTSSLLKRELCNAQNSKAEVGKELEHFCKMNGLLRTSLRDAKCEVTVLRENLQSLEKENARLLDSKQVSQLVSEPAQASVIYESPMPLRKSHSSDEDSDVQVMPSKQVINGNVKYKISNAAFVFPPKRMKVPEVQVIGSKSANDENSLICYAYNGLGGHSKFIGKTDMKTTFKPPSKRKIVKSKNA